MIYSLDVLAAVLAMVTGFSASWIGLEIARTTGWRQDRFAIGHRGVMRRCVDLALAALLGPRLLVTEGFSNWRRGVVSLPLCATLMLVAAGWSMCSGVLVLQAAFASGYFLA